MMGSTPDATTSVRLGRGTLVLVWDELEPIRAYVDPFPPRRRGFKVMYVGDLIAVPISSLDEILVLVREIDVHLATELREQEYEFADIASQVLDLGTVIVPTWRYQHLEERYAIQLRQSRPRIDGDTLRFLSRHFSLADLDAPLTDIALDLVTMKYEQQIVPPQRTTRVFPRE